VIAPAEAARVCGKTHVPPRCFDQDDEPVTPCCHGESDDPRAIHNQCMCGHPDYWDCYIAHSVTGADLDCSFIGATT
jgi:hypothetical protein